MTPCRRPPKAVGRCRNAPEGDKRVRVDGAVARVHQAAHVAGLPVQPALLADLRRRLPHAELLLCASILCQPSGQHSASLQRGRWWVPEAISALTVTAVTGLIYASQCLRLQHVSL